MVANILRLAVQTAMGEHNLIPPPPDPVVPAECLAFRLRDQGRELHVGVDSREEPVNVATVDRRVALSQHGEVLLRHRPLSISRRR